MVDLAVFSSGMVAMLSGLTVSTGAPALLPLLIAEVSPVDDATFFPQPTSDATMMEHSKTAETIRGMTDSGIAHLSLW